MKTMVAKLVLKFPIYFQDRTVNRVPVKSILAHLVSKFSVLWSPNCFRVLVKSIAVLVVSKFSAIVDTEMFTEFSLNQG